MIDSDRCVTSCDGDGDGNDDDESKKENDDNNEDVEDNNDEHHVRIQEMTDFRLV